MLLQCLKVPQGRLLTEIGFEIVQPEGIQGDTEISFEIVPKVETDIIIVLSSLDRQLDLFNSPDDLQDTLQKRWSDNPLLNSMPVFQNGRVYFVNYQLWGSRIRGPLTDRLILEALPDLLLSSVEGVQEPEEAFLGTEKPRQGGCGDY